MDALPLDAHHIDGLLIYLNATRALGWTPVPGVPQLMKQKNTSMLDAATAMQREAGRERGGEREELVCFGCLFHATLRLKQTNTPQAPCHILSDTWTSGDVLALTLTSTPPSKCVG